jgi:hypothetical protein
MTAQWQQLDWSPLLPARLWQAGQSRFGPYFAGPVIGCETRHNRPDLSHLHHSHAAINR